MYLRSMIQAKVSIKWLALLLRIREVPDLSFGTNYEVGIVTDFFMVFLNLAASPGIATIVTFHILSNSLFANNPIIQRYLMKY
jgi:hypothetical protein